MSIYIKKLIENNQYNEAIKACNNELEKAYAKEDENYLAIIKVHKAIAYVGKKEYDIVEAIYFEEIENNNIDNDIKVQVYINLGDLYTKIKKYDKSELLKCQT